MKATLEMALEALTNPSTIAVQHAIELIKTELAKPEQEPVAWMVRDQVDGCRYPSALKNPAGSINGESQPLYTSPRKEWVGLTDEETANICMKSDLNNWHDEQVIEAAEAKLREKNDL